ncbi:MAG: RecX family transcriptional regulator [Bacilli bacterium]|nr:RecX family transcriptional regulator [Bacilli bacterium]MBN2876042.1 RecX family transcriptional regulator [Bacilli bacterium]
MNKVTSVKSKKKQYLVEIKLDSKVKEYLVSEELLLEYRLVKGKELDDVTYIKFQSDLKKDANYQKVLHFALYKPRCTHEIVEFMKRKAIEEDQFKYHLNKLHKARILDDELYISNYINDAIEFKRQGPNKIRFDLENKKLSKDWIEATLSMVPRKTINANLQYLFDRKVDSLKKQSVTKAINQIKRFLVNKGYSFEDVNQVVSNNMNQIRSVSNEEEAILDDIRQAYRKYRNENEKKKEKILAYLLRKGYTYHTIKLKIGEYEDE